MDQQSGDVPEPETREHCQKGLLVELTGYSLGGLPSPASQAAQRGAGVLVGKRLQITRIGAHPAEDFAKQVNIGAIPSPP